MTHATVLVVDDDEGITSLLCDYLARYGFVAHAAADGDAMAEQLSLHAIELVILDVMLPGRDGLQLLRELRTSRRLPVILLTARGDAADRIVGLEMGADDYLCKPFDPRELVARMHSVLRRAVSTAPRPARVPIRFAGWQLDTDDRRLTSPQGGEVLLSDAEYRLLSVFLRSPRRVCTRERLMSEARGRERESTDRSIDLLVSRLRQKLTVDAETPSLIRTVRGAGYLLDAQPLEGRAA